MPSPGRGREIEEKLRESVKTSLFASQNKGSRVTEHASEGLSMDLAQMGCNMAIVEAVNAMIARCCADVCSRVSDRLPEQLSPCDQQPTQKNLAGPNSSRSGSAVVQTARSKRIVGPAISF